MLFLSGAAVLDRAASAHIYFCLTRFLDANRYPLRLKTLCRPLSVVIEFSSSVLVRFLRGWDLAPDRKQVGRVWERGGRATMCRNIKTLFNFEPPATEDEVRASALQFVRKLSGFNKPSQANAEAFDRAVAEVSATARRLLSSLHTHAPRRDREIEAERARERSKLRFG
jgi:hypothetical protein